MLGIAQNRDDVTRCRYCGEKLSLLQRLSRAEYCNAGHKESFQRDQEKLALGRLQQVAAEGREADIQGRLTKTKLGAGQGEWPEEPVTAAADSPRASAAPPPKPSGVMGLTYEDPEPASPAPPPCGPIYFSELAAHGQVTPIRAGVGDSLDLETTIWHFPESAAAPATAQALGVGVRQLSVAVPSVTGERRGWPLESRHEEPRRSPRFPALSIQSVDWSEALERTRRSYDGIPPLAGLIQIAGPQTLRFTARMRTPLALPESPAGSVVRAYKPGLARGAGMPNLAGAIRGLGTWRTRFGAEGSYKPLWEAELVQGDLATGWTPRYPVFYTTSPWNAEGLDRYFGLGPGAGPEVSDDEDAAAEPPSPRELTRAMAASLGSGALGAGSGEWHGSGQDAGVGSGSGMSGGGDSPMGGGRGSGAGEGQTLPGAAMPASGTHGQGDGMAAGVAPSTGRMAAGSGGGGSSLPGVGGGGGQGAGAAGMGAGAGIGGGGGLNPFGAGDGRGAVSVEAVAALVKAARQSDRSRAPLRDIEIALLRRPAAAPAMAAAKSWRGLKEGAARGLAGRGPVLTRQPMEWPAQPGPVDRQTVAGLALDPPVPECVLPQDAAAWLANADARLAVAPVFWSRPWLRAAAGPCEARSIDPVETPVKPAVSVPRHEPALPAAPGGAALLQKPEPLPEPWVDVLEAPPAATVRDSGEEPVAAPSSGLRWPVRAEPIRRAAAPEDALGFGEIERPGTQWVLLRGGGETATFRLSLDALRLDEPGPPLRAEWGPMAPAGRASGSRGSAIPASRGIVHRELVLQTAEARPLLEPLVCHFSSARGGVWDSRR